MNYPKNHREKRSPALRTVCPQKGCRGTLFNVSSRLSIALGTVHHQCDKCRRTYAVRITTTTTEED